MELDTYNYSYKFLYEFQVYTFHRFFAFNSTHNVSEVPNFISTFVLMLIVIILNFIKLAMWLKCVLYM